MMDRITSLGRVSFQQIRTLSNTSINQTLHRSSVAKHRARVIAQANKARQVTIKNSYDKVDPVLGRPACEFYSRIKAQVLEESVLASGYDAVEVEKLLYGAQKSRLETCNESWAVTDIVNGEEKKRNAIFKILDMQNSTKGDSKKIAIKLAQQEFSRFEGDTGSSEVQAAVMSIKIHFLMDHIKTNKKDLLSIKMLREMVQQRQRILKYLKTSKPEQYYFTIEKLGLNDRAVTEEFNLDYKYLQDYKIWGDKVLIKQSLAQLESERRDARRAKKGNRAANVARKLEEEKLASKEAASEAQQQS